MQMVKITCRLSDRSLAYLGVTLVTCSTMIRLRSLKAGENMRAEVKLGVKSPWRNLQTQS